MPLILGGFGVGGQTPASRKRHHQGMSMAHGHMAVVEESGARLREVGLDTIGKLWQMG